MAGREGERKGDRKEGREGREGKERKELYFPQKLSFLYIYNDLINERLKGCRN